MCTGYPPSQDLPDTPNPRLLTYNTPYTSTKVKQGLQATMFGCLFLDPKAASNSSGIPLKYCKWLHEIGVLYDSHTPAKIFQNTTTVVNSSAPLNKNARPTCLSMCYLIYAPCKIEQGDAIHKLGKKISYAAMIAALFLFVLIYRQTPCHKSPPT